MRFLVPPHVEIKTLFDLIWIRTCSCFQKLMRDLQHGNYSSWRVCARNENATEKKLWIELLLFISELQATLPNSSTSATFVCWWKIWKNFFMSFRRQDTNKETDKALAKSSSHFLPSKTWNIIFGWNNISFIKSEI